MSLVLFKEIIDTYQRHGWQLRRALLRPETRAELGEQSDVLKSGSIQDDTFDALWFARASHQGREAWELRLVAEQQYALFEAFEADEAEEDRAEVRLEMENKMRAQVTPAGTS
jgi:hypothetical protein